MIRIKYAIGYGMSGRFSKVPGERSIETTMEDLGLSSTSDDEQIRDAVWNEILEDIKRNANLDDVADNFDEVEMEIHEQMALARSREEAAQKATAAKHKPHVLASGTKIAAAPRKRRAR